MLRFEFRDGGSSKFWEAGVEEAVLTVRFGRIGTPGQTKSKTLPSAEAARKELDKLTREKIGKGYVSGEGGGDAPAAPKEKLTAPKTAGAPISVKASAPSDAFPLLGASPWRSENDGGEAPPDEPTAWAQLQRELGALKIDWLKQGEAVAPGGLARIIAKKAAAENQLYSHDRQDRREAMLDPLLRDADESQIAAFVEICVIVCDSNLGESAQAWRVQTKLLTACARWLAAARGGAAAGRLAAKLVSCEEFEDGWRAPVARAFRAALAPLQGDERDAARAALSAAESGVSRAQAEGRRIFLMGEAASARRAHAKPAGGFVDAFVLESLLLGEADDGAAQELIADGLGTLRCDVFDDEYLDMSILAELFATTIAAARRRGVSARPTLEALREAAFENRRVVRRPFTLALFEAGDPDPLASLLDHLRDKHVEAALAIVARRDPQALVAALAPHAAHPAASELLRTLAAQGVEIGVDLDAAPKALVPREAEAVIVTEGDARPAQEDAAPQVEAAAPEPPRAPNALRLLDVAPYPSRLRPGAPITATEPEAWAILVKRLAQFLRLSDGAQAAACKAQQTDLASKAPQPVAPRAAQDGVKEMWRRLKGSEAERIELLRDVRLDDLELVVEFAQELQLPHRWAPKGAETSMFGAALDALAVWAIVAKGPEEAGTILSCVFDKGQYANRPAHEPLDNVTAYAFRGAAARLSASDFDVFKRAALEVAALDPLSTVSILFMLGDDRPGGTTLALVEAAGIDVGQAAFALAADLGAADLARIADDQGNLYWSPQDAAVHAAAILAGCRARGEAALPHLKRFNKALTCMRDFKLAVYNYPPLVEERTLYALMLLETRETGALTDILAAVPNRDLAAAFDQAEANDPRFLFEELARLAQSGRVPFILKGRLARLAARPEAPAWAKALGPKVEAAVAALRKTAEEPTEFAPEADWPTPLRLAPWRSKGRGAPDLALSLDPIEAGPPGDGVVRNPAFFDSALLPHLREGKLHSKRRNVAEGVALDPADAARFVEAFVAELSEDWSSVVGSYLRSLHNLPEAAAIAAMTAKLHPNTTYEAAAPSVLEGLAKRFGPRAGAFIADIVAKDPARRVAMIRRCAVSALAPLLAPLLFVKKPNQRAAAQSWLFAHPRIAAFRLMPDALGPAGEARKAAEPALRLLAQHAPEAVEDAARAYEAIEPRLREALAQVLGRDPLSLCPRESTPAPGWALAASIPSPRLKDGRGLPHKAQARLIDMFGFGDFDEPYIGFDMVRDACDRASLARFVWALFEAWMAEGAKAKGAFALRALGWFGDDAAARELGRLVRLWPGEAAHARATIGLDALAGMGLFQGSEVALMTLNAIAEKAPFKGLKDAARRKIDLLAAARGLSAEELADRIAPDFGLDPRGGLDLDFGPRRFRVGFDETLKPLVRDAGGGLLKDLPKPAKTDDPEKAEAAAKLWAALKKDARSLGALQLRRLENMLADQRLTSIAAFRAFFVEHPLTRHLTQRLIWGLYANGEEAPLATFRVDDSNALSDQRDEPFDLPEDGEAAPRVGLVHPLHLDSEARQAWSQIFADYEIIQPFAQIDRPVLRLTEEEKASSRLDRVKGVETPTKRLRGAPNFGWRLGPPQDGGGVGWIEKEVRLRDGETAVVEIHNTEGIWMGNSDLEPQMQDLGETRLIVDDQPVAFGRLPDAVASEILRVLAKLVEPA